MERTTIKKKAKDLQKGDRLSTGTVTHTPYIDSKTPSGKIKLGIDGFLKVWNKETEIAVIIPKN